MSLLVHCIAEGLAKECGDYSEIGIVLSQRDSIASSNGVKVLNIGRIGRMAYGRDVYSPSRPFGARIASSCKVI